MSDDRVWQFLKKRLPGSASVMLAVVAASEGSSPGKPGFKMAVAADGTAGTVGGGALEQEVVKLCRDWLKDSGLSAGFSAILRRFVHREGEGEGRSGMICSGAQTVIFRKISDMDRPAWEAVLAAAQGATGTLRITADKFFFATGERLETALDFVQRSDQEWLYREQLGAPPVLSIIGGGHVSLALSRIMRTLGFYVRVFDDRVGVDTMESNSCAAEKHVIPYDRIGEMIPEGSDHYAVIMTFGHQSDESVLAQLVGKSLAYLGMLGSPAKVRQIFHNLEKKGFGSGSLRRVRAPVGLPIHSHTAEEIAVSIAAQIISERNAPPANQMNGDS